MDRASVDKLSAVIWDGVNHGLSSHEIADHLTSGPVVADLGYQPTMADVIEVFTTLMSEM